MTADTMMTLPNPDAAIDRSVIERYRTMADDAFVAGIIEQFLTESAVSIAALGVALAIGEAGSVDEAAHRLKGAAATVGARGVAAISDEIEVLARRGELDRVVLLCGALTAEFARTREELRALSFGGGAAIH